MSELPSIYPKEPRSNACVYCGGTVGQYVLAREGGKICLGCLKDIERMSADDNEQFERMERRELFKTKRLADKDQLRKARSNIALVSRRFSPVAADYDAWHNDHPGLTDYENDLLNKALLIIDRITGDIPKEEDTND